MQRYDPEYDFDVMGDWNEYDSPFGIEGDLEDLRRDAEWDYVYSEGEWEYYADLERDFDYDFSDS